MVRPFASIAVAGFFATGCASPGQSIFADYPEMAPGKTSWASVSGSYDGMRRPAAGESQLVTLADLVDRVVRRNPSIRAAYEGWRDRIEAVGTAGGVPYPEVAYTFLPLPVETRVGPNEHRVSLRQKIPSPLRLVAEHDGAVARADAGRFVYERKVLETLAALKTHVAEVRYLQRAVEVVTVNERLARELATAAVGRADADRGTLFDVSKARAQIAQLGYDRVRFDELLAAAKARLNAVLDRAPAATLPGMPAWPLAPLPPSPEALFDRALRGDPRMKGLDATIRARMAGVDAARGRYFPDLVFGVQLMVNGPGVAPNAPDSGREALGITFGLSLPLWFGANRARTERAEAALRREVHRKRAHVTTLLAEITDALYRLRNARRLVALYDRTLMPQAQKAMADADAWQRSGVAGFTDFLEARATLYRFGLARERAFADAVQAEARLELLIGGSLRGEGAP